MVGITCLDSRFLKRRRNYPAASCLGSPIFCGNRLAGLREKRYIYRIESAPRGVNEASDDGFVPQSNFPAHAVFNPVPPFRTLFSDGAKWIVSMTRRFGHDLELGGFAGATFAATRLHFWRYDRR